MKTSLVIIAAGLGSRYKGLKQLDNVGPNGESIMDYSIKDAITAGFDEIVLVIRKDFEKECRHKMQQYWGNKVAIKYAFQELTDLPPEYSLPEGRTKPWGTGHAMMAARAEVAPCFTVINADDYYGTSAFKTMHNYLLNMTANTPRCSLVGYRLGDTTSKNGSVSRGICTVDRLKQQVTGIHERKQIMVKNNEIVWIDTHGTEQQLDPNARVSMNFWGFNQTIFPMLDEAFRHFLARESSNLKSEFLIPTAIHHMIEAGEIQTDLLTTNSEWFGMTYPEDRSVVANNLRGVITPLG
ncbi:MAG: sugar phosphate nucleotidyltransferase [Zetaproteobacteria bacterium]|nr:sugar phosphate nucleotidyltransferase [Zetaproteobacteria bacterium]